MRKLIFIVALGLGFALWAMGCAGPRPIGVSPPPAEAGSPKPISQSSEAVASAGAWLRAHHLAWGEPQQILRTGSNWYRIEYARDGSGSERVVLVNPDNGRAEFPLRR